MTRGIPHGPQEDQENADFWRTKYAEELKRRVEVEKNTEKAVSDAAQKAKAEGRAEGRLEALKEHNIWKDGFLAGRHLVETTAAELPKDSHNAAPELITPLEA